MVRVFVFVSGIALAQFSATQNDPAFVLMASGHHGYPDFRVIHGQTQPHQPHVATIEHDFDRKKTELFSPVRVELAAPCASGACVIAPPEKIADLNSLVSGSLAIRPDCLNANFTNCNVGGNPAAGLMNLHLTFTGDWKVLPTIDCYAEYPVPRSKLAPRYNFVTPTKAWEVKFMNGSLELGNSMLFYADMDAAAVDDLMEINDRDFPLQIIRPGGEGSALCSQLGGFSAPSQCAIVAIRNQAENPVSFRGGADPHFAPLYSFLTVPPAKELALLPVALGDSPCPGGGGCCGLAGCIDGFIRK